MSILQETTSSREWDELQAELPGEYDEILT